MHIKKVNKSRNLYRSENTTTRHHSNNPGGEYRWERNKKRASDEDLPLRASMHGKQHRGRDYSPLFNFLLSKIGQRWDVLFSEAVKRLDRSDPIFWMVAQHEHQQRDIVCCGDFSFYPGLFIDARGLLQQVNPQITAEDLPVTCRCCTHTFIGVPVPWRGA